MLPVFHTPCSHTCVCSFGVALLTLSGYSGVLAPHPRSFSCLWCLCVCVFVWLRVLRGVMGRLVFGEYPSVKRLGSVDAFVVDI